MYWWEKPERDAVRVRPQVVSRQNRRGYLERGAYVECMFCYRPQRHIICDKCMETR